MGCLCALGVQEGTQRGLDETLCTFDSLVWRKVEISWVSEEVGRRGGTENFRKGWLVV